MVMRIARPPEIALAATTPLTQSQRAFRSAAKGRLDFALPLDVWFDNYYSVLPTQRGRPLAANGRERWYGYMQVVKRAVNPRAKRRVVIVSGGAMSGVRNPRS
jgi:hypothetical protein